MIPELEKLYDSSLSSDLPSPSELSRFYGSLSFPSHSGRPYVISNFVSTVDGVVSLDAPGKAVGDVISGSSEYDSIVMGLLRAAADVVIVGAGTLRASLQHIWTPAYIYPPYADAYKELRERLGKQSTPLNVIITAHGNIDMSLPLFQSGKVKVLILTTAEGEQRIRKMDIPKSVQIVTGSDAGSLTAREILKAIVRINPSCEMILIEGGPHLMGEFFAERCLDELFLTLSPQVAGRERSIERMGIVAEKIFAPDHPLWGKLLSVKRGGSHLFLRYVFETAEN
ncbi:MAG: dihydrofolate reductase family protein [Bacteroidota bacterium]